MNRIGPRTWTLEDRIKYRGCRNCIFHHRTTNQCAIRAPVQPPPIEQWCGEWRWEKFDRQTWLSGISPAEIEEHNNGKNAR